MARIARIKKLRGILDDIEAKCDRCSWIGPWGCNERCHIPGLKAIAEMMLLADGAYVEKPKKGE